MKKIILCIFISTMCFSVYSQSIPFENISYEKSKLPIVKLKIGRNEEKLFIVDSGASFSCINKDFIHDGYKIKYLKNNFNLVGFTQAAPESSYKLIDTFINDSIQSQFIGIDLSALVESMEDRGFNIYGIIGADFLCIHNCILDFNKRSLIISK